MRRRVRRLTPEELAELPPIKCRPVRWHGRDLGPWGRWRPGDPLGRQRKPTQRATESMLDWAELAWFRRSGGV